MNKTLLIFFAISLLALAKSKSFRSTRKLDRLLGSGVNAICFWFDTKSMAVFDLKGLKQSKEPRKIPDDRINGTEADMTEIYYSFCEDIKNDTLCKGKTGQVLGIIDEDGKKECRVLAGDIGKGNTWSLIDEKNPEKGVQIELKQGEKTPDASNNNYKVTFQIECLEDSELNLTTNYDTDSYNNILHFYTGEACEQMGFYNIWKFIMDKKYICALVIALIGLFLLTLGNRLLKATTFLICVLFLTIFLFVFLFQYIIPSYTADWVKYIVLGVGVVGGIILGVFVVSRRKIIFGIFLGTLSGYFLGSILFVMIISKAVSPKLVVEIFTYIICIAVLIVLSICLFTPLIIVCTSFLGSYAFIRAISILAGGFPSESAIIDMIKKGETEELKKLMNWKFYIYIAAIMVLFALSLVIQIKIRPKGDDEDKDDDIKENELLTVNEVE